MSQNENVIDIQNGNIYHDEALILNSVKLQVKKGEFTYMIGKTGTGKSSLLKTLSTCPEPSITLSGGLSGLSKGTLQMLRSRVQ